MAIEADPNHLNELAGWHTRAKNQSRPDSAHAASHQGGGDFSWACWQSEFVRQHIYSADRNNAQSRITAGNSI
jgi:hypothetical protein